jgi:hypothetical protein
MTRHTPAIGFLVIGAQKAGTTSLFEYLRRHPQIHMPAEKEISFFSRHYHRGWDWYTTTVLRDAPPDAVCGEASIGYMGGTPYADITANEQGYRPPNRDVDQPLEAVIPRRIKTDLPDVRLVCILRDPIARAYSHHQMAVLDTAETRAFDESVDVLLMPEALRDARITPTTTNGYIVNGEYCRLLASFLEIFPSDKLLILFSNELADRPIPTLTRVFDFVGVSSDFIPDNLNARYREAATERRISGFDLYEWQTSIARSRFLRACWHRLPTSLRLKIDQSYRIAGYRVTMWNARRSKTTQNLPAHTRARLIEHFLPDSQALSRLTGLEVPWLADWQES